ncbi:MAG: RNA polymerase sigma factor [Gammaproteobacteria bacterium]|nr:RNA polymerase sigma factor [Gammaproteobacteria bacterium]
MLNVLLQRKFVRKRVATLRERLFRTAYAWCHNRALADDLVQETSLKALENAGQLRDVRTADAWVFAILANCHRGYLRRADAVIADSDDEATEAEAGPEQVADQGALVERVRAAVARLNEEHRKVLTLVDLEGFSYTEVAEILEIPAGTVMSRLSRARRRLKMLLQSRMAESQGQISYLKGKR